MIKTGDREAKVVVAGGGVAGVTAAIASDRQGADTLLIERYGFLGGMFTGGNMAVLTARPVGGIGKEIVDTPHGTGCGPAVSRRSPELPHLP